MTESQAPAPGLVPLTDEQIGEIYEEALSYSLTMEDLPSVRAIVRKVEAVLSQSPTAVAPADHQSIATALRKQGERERTYELQDAFNRAAQIVERMGK